MSDSRHLIAVVDDEESVRRALKRLLVSAGFVVESFASGALFFSFLKTQRPDCVVLDLHMEGMTGFDVQEQLAQTNDSLPVISITGHDSPETQDRVLKAGAVAYLRKPIDSQILLSAVAKAIARGQNSVL